MVGAEDDIIGVPRRRAAQIIGVTDRQLLNWSRLGLIHPSIDQMLHHRRILSYGLEDLTKGRVIRSLQERGAGLYAIRRFVDHLRDIEGIGEPLTQLRWATDGGGIYTTDGDAWLGGKQPNQYVATQLIDLDEIRLDVRRRALERDEELVGMVERRRGALGSKPVFAGTRIPVATVWEYIEDGADEDEILSAYPALRPPDIAIARGLRIA